MESLGVAGPVAQFVFFVLTHVACVVAGVVWARRKGQTYLDAKAKELQGIRREIQARVELIPGRTEQSLDKVKVEVEKGLAKIEEAVKSLQK